jgi:predicted CoA-binding protein
VLFARVQDIQPPVDGALLMTSPTVTEAVVKGCAECGIKRVWMRKGVGEGSVSAKAIEACREHGIRVIPGNVR